MNPLSKSTEDALVAVARRVLYGIEIGEITAPSDCKKKLRDLAGKARQALLAAQRAEVNHGN